MFDEIAIAESNKYEIVESYIYFPPSSVKWQYLKKLDFRHTNPSLGEAILYDVEVKGKTVKNGAWSYPNPNPRAEHIKDYIAFAYGEISMMTERVE